MQNGEVRDSTITIGESLGRLVPDHLLTCSKVDDGKVWLVQWGGLPVSEATWEDESPTDVSEGWYIFRLSVEDTE